MIAIQHKFIYFFLLERSLGSSWFQKYLDADIQWDLHLSLVFLLCFCLCAFLSFSVSVCPHILLSVYLSVSFSLFPLLPFTALLPHPFSLSFWSVCTFVAIYLHLFISVFLFVSLSIFCISFSYHLTFYLISVSLCMCVRVCLLYVSTRVLNILGKILIGPPWVTCATLKNVILYRGWRQPVLCPSLLLGTGTGFYRSFCCWKWLPSVVMSTSATWSTSRFQIPFTVEWCRGSLFLGDPTRQMAELPLVLRSLLMGCQLRLIPSFVSHTVTWWHCWAGISEDRIPLVCEHNDLLIPDDILFPGVREVTTHCGSLDVDPVLKASLHFSLWILSLSQVAWSLSQVMEGRGPEEQASPPPCCLSHP